MPMFPDSGVTASEAKNSIDVDTLTPCDELWYSTSRCQPRFDPAAANAMLAEQMNLVMEGGLQYDCSTLDNIERAVRYIDQRGLPRAAYLAGGPNAYTGVLDPPLLAHNDFMTLTAIVAQSNQGAMTIDLGKGPVPLLRNDSQPMVSKDARAGIPFIIAYRAGNWYHVGLCASQVPLVVVGALDFWIRTDGNDTTGDGTANTADKAYKTIAGCWASISSRFTATPSFTVNMRLGIPGNYAGASISSFGGSVHLWGDTTNRAVYRITSVFVGNIAFACINANAMGSFSIHGVTFVMDTPAPYECFGMYALQSTVLIDNCSFDAVLSNIKHGMISVLSSFVLAGAGVVRFLGNGNAVGQVIHVGAGGTWAGCANIAGCSFEFIDISVNAAVCVASHIGTFSWQWSALYPSNVIGVQYNVSMNSVLAAGGNTIPGSIAGIVSTGGQYLP